MCDTLRPEIIRIGSWRLQLKALWFLLLIGGNMDYRNQARKYLENARNELVAKSDQRLKYAALELRMAMEALTYDRALAYEEEFPPEEYETWQPRKVMQVLLEIDPAADKDCSLAVGREDTRGVPALSMQSLGSEKVLNMSMIRKHYDALGSFLHTPTIKQSRSRLPVDFAAIRARCETIATFIDQVLASPIFNITLGSFSSIECSECGKTIRKRMPPGQKEVHAECYECKADYVITDDGDGKPLWKPQGHDVKCANPDCTKTIFIWQHEVRAGLGWKCTACHGENILRLGVVHIALPNGSRSETENA